MNDGVMEDLFFSVIVVILRNVDQYFVDIEKVQLVVGWLGFFNFGMFFSIIGNSRRNLCFLIEYVFFVKRFFLYNLIE